MRFDWLWAQSDKIFNLFLWHSLSHAIVPVVIGLILAIPVGWAFTTCHRSSRRSLTCLAWLYTISVTGAVCAAAPLLHTQILDPLMLWSH